VSERSPNTRPIRRVLIVSDSFPPHDRGGAERIAYYHAHALKDRGYEVGVLTAHESAPGVRPTVDEEEGVEVFRLLPPYPFSQGQDVSYLDKAAMLMLQVRNPWMQRLLADVVRRFAPDLMHAHHVSRLSYGAFARVAPGVPRALTFHVYHYECPKGGLYRKQRQAICERKPLPCCVYRDVLTRQLASVDRIVAISHFIQDRLIAAGYDPAKVVYIPNGVPGIEDRELTPVPLTKEVLFVGRVVHNKGLRQLLEAFRGIRDPEARLTVVGEGEDLPAIRRVYADDKRIRYLGWLTPEQVAERYRESRVVAVPSLWHEVMNTVICEGQSWGRPVVAMRVGGNPDLIEDGKSGILCPLGDAGALRAALERLLGDHALCSELGRRGFEHVRRFGMRRHVESIERLYRDMMAPRLIQ